MPRQTAGGRGSRVGTLSSQSTPLWTIRASMWPSWPCLTWCPCCSTVSMVSQGPVAPLLLSSSSPSRLAAAWSHRCFFGLVCNGRSQVPLRIVEGCMGWLGARWIDPVNLTAHKPLDKSHIGLLFCVSFSTACLLHRSQRRSFNQCCHTQLYKSADRNHAGQCYVSTSCCPAIVHEEIMWEWLISQCSSRARGCITVSLVSHEYFTVVFLLVFVVFLKKRSSKAWKLISLTRMLSFAWGQT